MFCVTLNIAIGSKGFSLVADGQNSSLDGNMPRCIRISKGAPETVHLLSSPFVIWAAFVPWVETKQKPGTADARGIFSAPRF